MTEPLRTDGGSGREIGPVLFSGVCDKDLPRCRFAVTVEENEPGRRDQLGITVTGALNEVRSQRLILSTGCSGRGCRSTRARSLRPARRQPHPPLARALYFVAIWGIVMGALERLDPLALSWRAHDADPARSVADHGRSVPPARRRRPSRGAIAPRVHAVVASEHR